MRFKRYIAVFGALLCLCGAVSCGGKSSSSSGGAAADNADTTENTAASVGSAEESTSSADLGEKITPDEDDEEYQLGDYYVSPKGTKLYFNTEEFPAELALFMEKYFTSYNNNDFDSYTSCLYPTYIDEMNKFLKKEYDYDLVTSFNNQCESLRSKMGGDYEITRIKIEPYDGDVTKFFEYPSSCFEKDYYSEIKDDVDQFYDMLFFVMAKGSEGGEEDLLISEYEIVFAEKDGRFYTFG